MADIAPTSRELEALKVLWRLERATVQQICNALCPANETLPYTTVLSLMQAMEKKGLVGHEKAGKAYVYYAKPDRERTCRTLAANLLHKVFDGAMDEYLARAMESKRLSLEDLERLEEMVLRAKRETQDRSRKGERSDECVD